jgi:hypothetical protein
MRVALSTYGDVEPMAGLAVQLRTIGAEVRVCAPPDCAEPDGYVAWVGDRTQLGLDVALTTWFGPPTAA